MILLATEILPSLCSIYSAETLSYSADYLVSIYEITRGVWTTPAGLCNN